MPAAFARWVRDPRSYTMVAEQDGRVVAVSRARLVSHDEAWGQGIRVDPRVQGHGLGQAITRHWPNVLYRRGARVARVAVLGENVASQSMVAKSGFRVVARTIRRGWWGQPVCEGEAALRAAGQVRRPRTPARLWALVARAGTRAANGRLVLVRDYYVRLTRARTAGYVRRGAAYLASRAFCLVDRRRIGLVPRPGWWIVAIGGPPREAASLACEIVRRAVRHGVREVWIDAGRDRRLVRALERAGFTGPPASEWGEVVVMEARLPLRG